MPVLDCNVVSCIHNADKKCCKGNILVEGFVTIMIFWSFILLLIKTSYYNGFFHDILIHI